MVLVEVRERLKKRKEEVRDLKLTLNGQISQVDAEYRRQLQEYEEQNQNLQNQLQELQLRLTEETRLCLQAQEERADLADRYDR